MMTVSSFHEEYNRLLTAFRRQISDSGLRVLLRKDADAFFRACALGVWQADGAALTPDHGEYYNAIYCEGNRMEPVLFWSVVEQGGQAGFQIPSFFLRMARHDKEMGRSTARRFLPTFSLLMTLFAAVDGSVSQGESVYIQNCIDQLATYCDRENLPGDRTPVTVAPYVTAPNGGEKRENTPSAVGQTAQETAAKGETATQTEAAPAEKEPTLEELLAELDELCGLDKVKEDVHSLMNLVKVRKLREEAGLSIPPMSLHMVFMGNPGTGKTTVARLLAKLYKAMGVLSKGQLVEVDRSGLVAGYVGQTAIKTGEAIQKALGGILFVDEAYALAPEGGNANDFGQEAIEILLKGMEDNRKDLIVIVAGYTELMDRFIHANPGLESRFNKYMYFEDYTGEQLMDIFRSLCKKNQYTLSPEAETDTAEKFKTLFEHRDENFGNARDVRNVFEKAISNQADRVAKMENPDKEALMTILLADLEENKGKKTEEPEDVAPAESENTDTPAPAEAEKTDTDEPAQPEESTEE